MQSTKSPTLETAMFRVSAFVQLAFLYHPHPRTPLPQPCRSLPGACRVAGLNFGRCYWMLGMRKKSGANGVFSPQGSFFVIKVVGGLGICSGGWGNVETQGVRVSKSQCCCKKLLCWLYPPSLFFFLFFRHRVSFHFPSVFVFCLDTRGCQLSCSKSLTLNKACKLFFNSTIKTINHFIIPSVYDINSLGFSCLGPDNSKVFFTNKTNAKFQTS